MTSVAAIQAKLVHTLNEAVAGLVVPHPHPLEKPIAAEQKTMTTHHGQRLTYYVSHAVHGRPVVLLHSVNACASSYETRPLFEHFRRTRPVYALDLPGFGLSQRDDRPYTVELFADSIREVLARVADRDAPADVVALSLTSEFAARVALQHKDLFHSLTLVSPTGFGRRPHRSSLRQRLNHIACSPAIGPFFFGAITSRLSIRYFLGRSFAGRPDAGLLGYAYETAHQAGAEHAPLAFVEGTLFTPQVRDAIYARLATPTLVLYDEDGYVRFDALSSFVAEHPAWEAHRVARTRGMPQFENLADVVAVLDAFTAAPRRHPSAG